MVKSNSLKILAVFIILVIGLFVAQDNVHAEGDSKMEKKLPVEFEDPNFNLEDLNDEDLEEFFKYINEHEINMLTEEKELPYVGDFPNDWLKNYGLMRDENGEVRSINEMIEANDATNDNVDDMAEMSEMKLNKGLILSQRRIEYHLTRVFSKLGAELINEAAVKAQQYGLLSVQPIENK